MRVLVVLYHMGDALARKMEREGVSASDVEIWCADWEAAASGCSDANSLGWVTYADSLVGLISRTEELVGEA